MLTFVVNKHCGNNGGKQFFPMFAQDRLEKRS